MALPGLNDHHQSVIVTFIRFTRYQRSQNLKSIEASFKDVIDSRLLEDTFTADEVREMLTGLCQVVRADVESELMTSAHTKVLLLKQLFSQAEKWHLNLQPDLSELENREQLETIKSLEDTAFNISKSEIGLSASSIKLAPLGDVASPVCLLNLEIERLKEDKKKMAIEADEATEQVVQYCSEIMDLSQKLEATNLELSQLKDSVMKSSEVMTEAKNFDDVEKKLLYSEKILKSNLALSITAQESLKVELREAEKHLTVVKAQLQLAEQELERKFSETTAYANVMKMLGKKNETIKNLRQIIKKYEPEETENEESE